MGHLLAILNSLEASARVILCPHIGSCFVLLGYRAYYTQLNLKVLFEVFLYVVMDLEFHIYFLLMMVFSFVVLKNPNARLSLIFWPLMKWALVKR